jgi:hypothetical protein
VIAVGPVTFGTEHCNPKSIQFFAGNVHSQTQLLEPGHRDHANNATICSQTNLGADIAMQQAVVNIDHAMRGPSVGPQNRAVTVTSTAKATQRLHTSCALSAELSRTWSLVMALAWKPCLYCLCGPSAATITIIRTSDSSSLGENAFHISMGQASAITLTRRPVKRHA